MKAETKTPGGSHSKRHRNPRIEIEEHGPYHVLGNPRLTRRIRVENDAGEAVSWKNGDDIPAPEREYKLCRCGHSQDKPFCDSSHLQVQWEGDLTADQGPSEARRKIYPGKGIVLTDDESLCAGYAFCDRFGGVWDEIEHTEDPEVRKQLERQILLCPSGRLQWKRTLSDQPVEEPGEPTIAVIPNGALWLLGGIEVVGSNGEKYQVRQRQLLCRCGQSSNKPFCDGTHWNIKFRAP